jgi:Peptidase A4 family
MRSATIALAVCALVAGCSAGVPVAPIAPVTPLPYGGPKPLDATFVAQPADTIPRVYQPDWAGPVLFAPDQKPLRIPAHRFHIVEGEWVVPKARPTINCSNPHEPEDGSSLWIAIDGWSATFIAHYKKHGRWHTYPSTDILQAGTESDVPCYHGGRPARYPTSAYFWIEWAGVRNIAVTRHHRNLILHPGDKIYVRIEAATTGPHAWREATLWFVNETTGYYLPPRTFHSGCVDCGTPFQRPATLFGNTAEWMVEATFYDYGHKSWPNTLDDFGDVKMTRVFATDQDGVTYDLAHPAGANLNVDWMTWNGVPLA